jgi:hypothetical protein
MAARRSSIVIAGSAFLLGVIVAAVWNGTPEAQAQLGTALNQAKFKLVYANHDTTWDMGRYNPRTGETWIPTNDTFVWAKLNEEEKLPEGNYEVAMMVIEGSSLAVRLNTNTGEGWYRSGGDWVKVRDR